MKHLTFGKIFFVFMLFFRIIEISSNRIITSMGSFIFLVNFLIFLRKISPHFLFVIFSILTLHDVKLSDLRALIFELSIWCWINTFWTQIIRWDRFVIYWIVDISYYLLIFPLNIGQAFAFSFRNLTIESNDVIWPIILTSHLQMWNQRTVPIFLDIILKFCLFGKILVFLQNWIKLSLLLSDLQIGNSLGYGHELFSKGLFGAFVFFISPHLIFPALVFLLASF